MKRERLELKHRTQIHTQIQAMGLALSPYSFANAFIFKDLARGAEELRTVGEDAYIWGRNREGWTYWQPLHVPSYESLSRLKTQLTANERIYPLPTQWLPSFKLLDFELGYDPDDSDYLLDRKSLETYAGRHLQGKRNLVHQFERDYQVESRDYCAEDELAVDALLQRWQEGHAESFLHTDVLAAYLAIQKAAELELKVRVTWEGQRAIAVILGEALNADTYVMHVAKADKEYKGVYQYAYQDFARSIGPRYRWVNIEEDLGRAPLRQSKQSYHPEELLPKFWAR